MGITKRVKFCSEEQMGLELLTLAVLSGVGFILQRCILPSVLDSVLVDWELILDIVREF